MNQFSAVACIAYLFFALSLWNYGFWRTIIYADYLAMVYALIGVGVLVCSLVFRARPIPLFPVICSIIIGLGLTYLGNYGLSKTTGVFMAVFIGITIMVSYRATQSEIRLGSIVDVLVALVCIGLCARIAFDPHMIQTTFFRGLAVVVAINALSYLVPRAPKHHPDTDIPATINRTGV